MEIEGREKFNLVLKLQKEHIVGLHLRKVHARNRKTYATNDVNNSSVHVGWIRTVGIIGTKIEPHIHPVARAPSLWCNNRVKTEYHIKREEKAMEIIKKNRER